LVKIIKNIFEWHVSAPDKTLKYQLINAFKILSFTACIKILTSPDRYFGLKMLQKLPTHQLEFFSEVEAVYSTLPLRS